ncbi:hypothetical protein [Jidongwangia harbinensis]|uniref:hypothetical protein n=1 Tax=Jidongwangia harbinensis TaxID=2878561 RepID=UPI001CD9480A|nr:hypothetical protein [Jidongwangia harbinensis]MCA2211982.1 hypothetical protein [Jidongwangia harbinensis]
MSDVSSGARAPDATPGVDVPAASIDPAYPAASTYPATTSTSEYATGTTYPATTETYPATTSSGEDQSKAKQVAGQAKEVAGQTGQAAGQAAGQVKDTAVEQAQRVGSEAKTQVRNVAGEVRSKVQEQARSQNDKLVGSIRQMADHLEEMRGDRQDSPAAAVVSRVADGGRQMADYLDQHGPEGVLREVQDFARRRPGAFLATALAAGFVVARLGKGVAKADDAGATGSAKPASDSFVSNTPDNGYATGYSTGTGYTDPATTGTGYTTTSTEYASTGTGTPVAVEEDYLLDPPTGREYPGGTR